MTDTDAVLPQVPHKVMEDDTYNGWHIPAGSTVIGNSWGIHRDPEYFKDGDDFRPERYMPGPERDKIFSALSKGHTSFGHGRRVCPGNSLAGRSLAVAITQIFWAFDVVAVSVEDEYGSASSGRSKRSVLLAIPMMRAGG